MNKYNEIVTDESSSKWQLFLFQIKDNPALKTFLKEKIKSEHFHEYIKTRKGKDQKVFYEFRIGVIYGKSSYSLFFGCNVSIIDFLWTID